tara:strand:+ start:95 stop:352 length:258 start_codon:yes stop_codon:yes gene_type:complete
MESAILERCAFGIHVSNINSDALLIGVLGLENVFDFHDLEGATIPAREGRGFAGGVLDGLTREMGSKLDMVEPSEGGEGNGFLNF